MRNPYSRLIVLLSLASVFFLALTPAGVGQTSLTTTSFISTSTLQSNPTGTFAVTSTSVSTVTSSLTVSQTSLVYSTYTSTSTGTSTSELTSESSTFTSTSLNPSFSLILDVLAAAFLIFAVVRYWKRRRK